MAILVTRAPHWDHQNAILNLSDALVTWSRSTGLGKVSVTPWIVFPDHDNVIPDLVWISTDRLARVLTQVASYNFSG